MKKIIRILLLILYIELFVFFCYQSSKTGEESAGISLEVAKVIKNMIESVFNNNVDIDKIHGIIRKVIGHFSFFGLFSIVSFCFYITFKNRKIFIIHFLVGLVLAVISEFVFEANSIGRSANLMDVGIDYAGFLVGTLFTYIIYYFTTKKKRKSI